MIDVIKSIGCLHQDLDQYIFFSEWAICFPCFAMIGKTVGLAKELRCAYNRDGVYKILFLQYILYKTNWVTGCIQHFFDLCNGLALGS